MRTRFSHRLLAGFTTAAVFCGCMGFGSRNAILSLGLSDFRASAAVSSSLMMGDVNFDGIVNADDSCVILYHYLSDMMGIPDYLLDELQQKLADVDHDAEIDCDDAGTVLYHYVESIVGMASEWETYSSTYPVGRNPLENTTTTTTPVNSPEFTLGTLQVTLGADANTADKLYGTPSEVLQETFGSYTLNYRIYRADSADMTIVMTDDSKIVGAFQMADKWSTKLTGEPKKTVEPKKSVWIRYEYDKQATVTECYDRLGSNALYGVLVMKNGYTVNFSEKSNLNDFSTASKLCWYVTNALRAKHNQRSLYWHEGAADCAKEHSIDMATNGFMDHHSTDGLQFTDRLENHGINWKTAGENVDQNYPNVFLAVNGWYNSATGHRDNMLDPAFRGMGAGFAYSWDSQRGTYGTQDFFAQFGDA